MLYKKIILFIFLINISSFLSSESLILSNGKVFNGKLFLINKNYIILIKNNKLFKFNYNLIDCLIHNCSQEKETALIINKNNGISIKINLIKLTKIALFYKDLKNNKINLIHLDEIKNIKLETIPKIDKNIITEKFNINTKLKINSDFENLIKIIIKKNKLNNNLLKEKKDENNKNNSIIFLSFEEIDFYEKFWKKINNYISDDTKNILWNLYELYSNKEKYLNILKNITNEKNASYIDKFNDKIIELRKEFYNRAKKIIYNSEILTNFNKLESNNNL